MNGEANAGAAAAPPPAVEVAGVDAASADCIEAAKASRLMNTEYGL
jgi:hypothetical protein